MGSGTPAKCKSKTTGWGSGKAYDSGARCGADKVYDSSKATANCAAATCATSTTADVTACCKSGTPAKCKSKTTGWGSGKAYDSGDAEKYCVGTECSASSTADKTVCTKTVGICSDFFATQGDGSAARCGADKVYDSSKATANCAAATCATSTTADV